MPQTKLGTSTLEVFLLLQQVNKITGAPDLHTCSKVLLMQCHVVLAFWQSRPRHEFYWLCGSQSE